MATKKSASKKPTKKLGVTKQTLKKLAAVDPNELAEVAGGAGPVTRQTCLR